MECEVFRMMQGVRDFLCADAWNSVGDGFGTGADESYDKRAYSFQGTIAGFQSL